MTTPKQTDSDSNAIISDLHRTRESIAASFDNDLHRLTADARDRQRRAGRPVWRPDSTKKGMKAGTPLSPRS